MLVTPGARRGAPGMAEVLADVPADQQIREARRRVANGDGD